MVNLDNSEKRLKAGLVRLLRDNVSGWSTNSEENVNNVWPSSTPESARDEFPRATVDVISGEDFELSVDLGVRLRVVTVKIVVWGEVDGPVEDLVDSLEDAIVEYWDAQDSNSNPYLGDWTYRELDGTTPMNEDEGSEGELRYNRSKNVLFETVKDN